MLLMFIDKKKLYCFGMELAYVRFGNGFKWILKGQWKLCLYLHVLEKDIPNVYQIGIQIIFLNLSKLHGAL